MLKIGTICQMGETTYDTIIPKIAKRNLNTCQLVCWEPSFYDTDFDKKAAVIRKQLEEYPTVKPSAIWAGYTGMIYWNFTEGPATLGIVPPEHRYYRVEQLKKAADFAQAIGVRAIITHAGFLPENIIDPLYRGTVLAVNEIAQYCKARNIQFWFETGQETPVTLLRVIQEVEKLVGKGILGINLDPANLLLYGKGNPIDALSVFGKYVQNIHVKDGCVPTDGYELGKDTQVGKGMVNYPAFIKKLQEVGFDGEYIIEREIGEDTPQQLKDIEETIANLHLWTGEN